MNEMIKLQPGGDIIRVELRDFLCEELDVEKERADAGVFSHRVYKGTTCGAWLAIMDSRTIMVGSIVEGCDFDTDTITLEWPFTKKVFWSALDAVENEADYIWSQTHGCEDCKTEGEWGHDAINPECKTCHGQGAII